VLSGFRGIHEHDQWPQNAVRSNRRNQVAVATVVLPVTKFEHDGVIGDASVAVLASVQTVEPRTMFTLNAQNSQHKGRIHGNARAERS
jgi:hypothetical protein